MIKTSPGASEHEKCGRATKAGQLQHHPEFEGGVTDGGVRPTVRLKGYIHLVILSNDKK